MLRTNRLGSFLTSIGLAAALAVANQPAHAVTIDVEFTASHFIATTSYWLTHEAVPQDEVSGSFHVVTDVAPDPEANPDDRVTDVYLHPVEGEIAIAGVAYAPDDLTAYVGYQELYVTMLQVGGTGPPGAILGPERPPGSDAPGPAVHVVTQNTDDFNLVVVWDALGNLLGPGAAPGDPSFVYSTAQTEGGFWPGILTITASIDGAVPQQLTVTQELPDPTVCEGASPEGPPVQAGRFLCYPPVDESEDEGAPDEGARAASPSTLRLRDVPVAGAKRARRAEAGRAVVETALGSLTVTTQAVDRTLLRANEGLTPAVEPPADPDAGALDCAPAKVARGSVRLRPTRNALAAGERYRISGPSRLCTDPSGAGGDLLCYRARLENPKPRARGADVWIAHALGTERLHLKRGREICLPAEILE